jgi:hypothetical protein
MPTDFACIVVKKKLFFCTDGLDIRYFHKREWEHPMCNAKKLPVSFGVIVCAVCMAATRVGAATSYSVVFLGSESYATAANDGQQVGYGPVGASPHALLWSGSAQSMVDLNPAGATDSQANGVSNGQQVGSADVGGQPKAILWSGSAASAVDLTPSGYTFSFAYGVSNGQQVGTAYTTSSTHAFLWSGSAASAIDLNPAFAVTSDARAISNGQIVGIATLSGITHAVLWNGSAQSAVDLNPSGFDGSQAYGVSNGQQVGYGVPSSASPDNHALLWSGSAASAIDLNPTGFINSQAVAIADGEEVGYGTEDTFPSFPSPQYALAWSGTAASVVNLQQFLPGIYDGSQALGIDAAGDIVGVATIGTSRLGGTVTYQAVMWVPQQVPLPPAAWMVLTTLGLVVSVYSVVHHLQTGAGSST